MVAKLRNAKSTEVILDELTQSVRTDGWEVIASGLGRKGKDKRTSIIATHTPLREEEAEDLYASDKVAERIVDKLPDEALRGWIVYKDVSPADQTKISDYCYRLRAKERVKLALKWARKYGGSAILMTADDGLPLDKPLDIEKVRSLKSLVVLSRWELWANGTDIIRSIEDPDFGMPRYYTLIPRRGVGAVDPDDRGKMSKAILQAGVRIHYSRLIRFDGAALGPRAFSRNGYWSDSVLTKSKEPLQDYSVGHGYGAAAVHDINVGVLTMDNLVEVIGGNRKAEIYDRIEIMNYVKSLLGTILLGKGESFEVKARNVAGLSDILDRLKSRLGACTEYPNTVLFNEGPKDGLGSKGDAQEETFDDTISAFQENEVEPKLDRLFEVIMAAADGPKLQDWDYEFPPLQQPSQKDQAETEKAFNEADDILIGWGVDPQLILEKRRGGESFNPVLTFDKSEIQTVEKPEPILPGAQQGPPDPEKEAQDAKAAKAVMDVLLDEAGGRAILGVTIAKATYPSLDEAKAALQKFGGTYLRHDEKGSLWSFVQGDAKLFDAGSLRSFTPSPSVRITYGKMKP